MNAFPGWPEPRFIQTNGIRMAVYESGPRGAKPTLVLCHGFPELAFSWRHQLRDLGAQGFRVLAPDQRGYGLTDKPAPVDAYDMDNLCADLIGLLDDEGVEKAVFVGHDWGGIIVWQMPLLHPERVAGVIGVNTPFMPRPPVDPIAIMRARMGEDMYIVKFQTPKVADDILAANARKAMDFFMRRPMPGQAPSAGLASEKGPDGESAFALLKMVEAYDPAFDPRETFLTAAEFAFFVDTFERTGFTGGINWYRNFTRNWERAEGRAQRVDCPSLMIMAELDAVLPPSAADGMETFVPHLSRHLIKGSGHWTQQEKPAETTAAIADWVRKTFR